MPSYLPLSTYVPHKPGAPTALHYQRGAYDDYQWALHLAWTDAWYMAANGLGMLRGPTPGLAFDQQRYDAWREKVLYWSDYESQTRDQNTQGIDMHDWPDNLWLYLFERMCAADTLKLYRPGVNVPYDD